MSDLYNTRDMLLSRLDNGEQVCKPLSKQRSSKWQKQWQKRMQLDGLIFT
jgi:hypothetical protein